MKAAVAKRRVHLPSSDGSTIAKPATTKSATAAPTATAPISSCSSHAVNTGRIHCGDNRCARAHAPLNRSYRRVVVLIDRHGKEESSAATLRDGATVLERNADCCDCDCAALPGLDPPPPPWDDSSGFCSAAVILCHGHSNRAVAVVNAERNAEREQ